jgi:hypothetical protein
MIRTNRVPLIKLGLVCLMPALFFWVLHITPISVETTPSGLIFGQGSGMELAVCGIVFPLFACLLGWLALRSNNRKRMAWFIFLSGLIQTAAGIGAAVFG